ncbi:hypothetical protein SAMN05421825_2919 [Epilithonimonas hungarica]|uniref:Uncharacterized protein n=1 Tax=Epilithonimonas hungarica TaxID=454006 RepID=A0A1G7SA84_9FLAO|nr:hypothetical protein SAMN05421825_2919 [Epilithonimonas hungarica]
MPGTGILDYDVNMEKLYCCVCSKKDLWENYHQNTGQRLVTDF